MTSPCKNGMGPAMMLLILAAGTWVSPAAAPGQPAGPDMEQPSPAGETSVMERILRKGLPRTDETSLQDWPAGPVRYILSGPETRLYRKLENDRQRRAFIQQFWSRRDPKIDSLENEYRFAFWSRVAAANQLFTRSTQPGWKTDRGRFYIMLGPPSELEADVMPNQRSGLAVSVPRQRGGGNAVRVYGGDKPGEAYHGLERWIYRNRPTSRLPPHFVLAFRLTPSGEYELSRDSRDWTLYQNMMSESVRAVVVDDVSGKAVDPGRQASLLNLYQDVAVALDLGTLTHVPQPDELLGELVTSEEFFGRIPFLLRSDFYKTTGSDTLVVFTVGADATSFAPALLPRGGDLLVVGRLESVEDPQRIILLAGDQALVPAPAGAVKGILLYQVVMAVPPGAYNASFGILDRENDTIGSYRERVKVPAFPASGLALSTLALAHQLQPVADDQPRPGPEAAAPFRLGNYRVIPRTQASLQNGEEFALYYQVYGAARDATTGHPRLHVTYRFFVLRDGEFSAIGRPIIYRDRTRSVQGWSFPLINWPAATFRLEVTVEDDISGDVTVGQTVFGIKADIEPS